MNHQKPRDVLSMFTYRKARMSAGIFLMTVIIGGLTIFAATNLDNLKAGANGNTLTAANWDSLIEHVKNHDLIIGAGLSKVDTDVLRVESKVDALQSPSGGGASSQGIDTQLLLQLSGIALQFSGVRNQLNGVDTKLSGLSGAVIRSINNLSGLNGAVIHNIHNLSGWMMDNLIALTDDTSRLKEDTSTLKSNASTLITNITRVEGKIDLLSGDSTNLQEIKDAIHLLEVKIQTLQQHSDDESGLVLTVKTGKVLVCQKRDDSSSPGCTTETLAGATPYSNTNGGGGIVVAVGAGRILVCQKRDDSSSPGCTTETLAGATPYSSTYGGGGVVMVVGASGILVCQKRDDSSSPGCTTRFL